MKTFQTNYLIQLIITGFALVVTCCNVTKKPISGPIDQLKLINIYEVPGALPFKGTTVGGLSGIDYNSRKDEYYMICDDRSDINPSRFYKARILIGNQGIDSVEFLDAVTLRDKNGRYYSNQSEDPFRRIDPEGMRLNALNGYLYWTNEGERTIVNGKEVNCDPSINIVDQTGHFLDSFLLPANTHVHSTEKGIRRNGAFEGLSFDKEYRYLYVNIEEPLYEDGPRAGLGDSTAWVRFIKFDVASRKPVAQYAYQIDAIPYPADPAGAFKINGVPEILYLGEDKMLVIERSFSTGRKPCVVKIYLGDLSNASDVSDVHSLVNNSTVRPISKKLILNMDKLGRYVDNVEGICFGPVLPNGNPSLLLVSDDNFSETQKTQIFLFEVLR